MFLKKKLKRLGIEVIGKVEDKTIIEIANQVATKLTEAFPESNISYLEIYKKILDTPIYYANISNGMSEANFYYKNSSIYISAKTDLNKLNEFTLHEFIHRIQENRNKKGKLLGMGLCEINELSVKGTALNESAIQYIVSKALQNKENTTTVYNITFTTKTQYYPILTNLITQIVFLIGENYLIDSTINSNENFKIEIIDNFGEIEYNHIERNFNEILEISNKIISLKIKENNKEENKILESIQNIQKKYIETQNLICTSYFEKLLKRVENIEEINNLKNKLYSYKEIVGSIENYKDIETYCVDFELRAEKKAQKIIANTSLAVIKDNIIYRVFRNLKKLFNNSTNEYNK